MTGEFGLCGYFYEYNHDLAENERLRFAKDERPPPFIAEDQPEPPPNQWGEVRLEKANRNYALDYIRNGLCELKGVIGEAQTLELGGLAARLIGLQYFAETASMIGARDGNLADAAEYLATLFAGMGDAVLVDSSGASVQLTHSDLRVVRGLQGAERELVLACWTELWRGTMASQQQLKSLDVKVAADALLWQLSC
jgi:hypothetical protein